MALDDEQVAPFYCGSDSGDSERGPRRPQRPADNECAFFASVGACRHGAHCRRTHNRPETSRTLVLARLLARDTTGRPFDAVYEDVFAGVALAARQAGARIEEMAVCENGSAHLCGSVFVRLDRPVSAAVVGRLSGRWFARRPVWPEVACDVRWEAAVCGDHAPGATCLRGAACNKLHVRQPAADLKRELLSAR